MFLNEWFDHDIIWICSTPLTPLHVQSMSNWYTLEVSKKSSLDKNSFLEQVPEKLTSPTERKLIMLFYVLWQSFGLEARISWYGKVKSPKTYNIPSTYTIWGQCNHRTALQDWPPFCPEEEDHRPGRAGDTTPNKMPQHQRSHLHTEKGLGFQVHGGHICKGQIMFARSSL